MPAWPHNTSHCTAAGYDKTHVILNDSITPLSKLKLSRQLSFKRIHWGSHEKRAGLRASVGLQSSKTLSKYVSERMRQNKNTPRFLSREQAQK